MPRRLKSLTEEHLLRMNIGRRYWTAHLDQSASTANYWSVIRKYVQELRSNIREGWGLFLWGANSTGKTWIASAVLKEAALQCYSTFAITAEELRQGFIDDRQFNESTSIRERVQLVDVLLLDDLGAEYEGKGSKWAALCMDNLFRARTRELRPTIVTTNMSKRGFAERYKASVVAVGRECMIAVKVEGKDWRKEAEAEKLTAMGVFGAQGCGKQQHST